MKLQANRILTCKVLQEYDRWTQYFRIFIRVYGACTEDELIEVWHLIRYRKAQYRTVRTQKRWRKLGSQKPNVGLVPVDKEYHLRVEIFRKTLLTDLRASWKAINRLRMELPDYSAVRPRIKKALLDHLAVEAKSQQGKSPSEIFMELSREGEGLPSPASVSKAKQRMMLRRRKNLS